MNAYLANHCGSCGGPTRVRRVLLVQAWPDLALLRTWRRRYDQVRVRIADLPESERSRLEETVVRDYFACGCLAARWAAIGVAGFVSLTCAVAWDFVAAASWEGALIAVFAIILIPMATMLASVARARMRLWRLLDAAAR
jgi:hypothetical protein